MPVGDGFGQVQVGDLRCEYLTDPLGIDTLKPRFFWKITDSAKTRGQQQTAYHILVSSSRDLLEKNQGTLWDSQKTASSQSALVLYNGSDLKSDQDCYWKVRLWDKEGRATPWSRPARFSVGLLQASDWKGDWIRYEKADDDKHIWYRKNFSLSNQPSLALAHISSLGYHELYVNGKKIATRVLSPGITNLNKRVLSITYDITSELNAGDNVIAIWTGPGWANAVVRKPLWKHNKSLLNCQVNMSNGMTIHCDSSWKCKISSSEKRGQWKGGGGGRCGGEIIDMRRAIASWNAADYDDSSWENASIYDREITISPAMIEPDRKTETIIPISITGENPYVVDMGTNYTGWFEINLRNGTSGQTVKFKTANRPGKTVDFDQESHFIYNSSGSGTFCHRFNYMAGRWVQIEGLSYKPALSDIKGYIVTNDRKRLGQFECSNTLFNDIYETDIRTYVANSVNGVVMDCPHRERYGYGEVAFACSWGIGFPNFESGAFYTKNLRDWRDAQSANGFINTLAPQTFNGWGGTLWSSAPITLSWEFYRACGDKRILRDNYPAMKKWLDYLHGAVSDGVLGVYADENHFLGDWATPHGNERGTIEAKFFNNCVYAYDLDVFVKIAEILGKSDDIVTYSARLQSLRSNVHKTYYDSTGKTYLDGRQLRLAFPLYVGITPDSERDAVFAAFVNEITNKRPYLDTGSSGIPILLKYLIEDIQRCDLIYHCLTRTEFPSYGYFLANGETTWPEFWDNKRASRIHTCYTSIAGYFIKGIGGILPDPEQYGMKQFIIRPQLVGDLTYARTTSGSYYGQIISNWSRSGKAGMFHVEIPANTQAKVYIPAKRVGDVRESGIPVSAAPGVTYLRMDGIYAVFQVESGMYDFSSASVPPPASQ